MTVDIPYRRDPTVRYGVLEAISPLIRRIVARNPGPFTFTGTATYVVGRGTVAIIDPGPDDPAHVEALLGALAGETVSHILVTHTHLDHSPAARAVKRRTAAPTYGFGRHGGGLTAPGDPSDAGADWEFAPDVTLADGDMVEGAGWRLEALHTPGHTSNHLSFALPDERRLFSGDHVMAWSTSIIAPPDGDMAAYRASLARLLERADAEYLPTHGPAVLEPERHVRAFLAHRAEREAAILARLAAGDRTIATMVPAIYAGTAPALYPAAARSVLAHLLDLEGRGRAVRKEAGEKPAGSEPAGLSSVWEPA